MISTVLLGWCLLFGGCGDAKLRCGPAGGLQRLDFNKVQTDPFDSFDAKVMIRCRMKIMPTWKQQYKGLK